MTEAILLRLAAFTTEPAGGNPAGVWIGRAFPTDAEMQRHRGRRRLLGDGVPRPGRPGDARAGSGSATSARSPRSRSAATPRSRAASPWPNVGSRRAPEAPGDSCDARPRDERRPGRDHHRGGAGGGLTRATLTSVATWVREPDPDLLAGALDLLGWHRDDLDPALPPAVGFAGAKHLILAARERDRLATLDYPFEPMKALMLAHDLTTIQLVWREAADRFRARDPFPVGGVVEDPATGAAAAALGAYLRERGEIVAAGDVRDRPGRRDGPAEPVDGVGRAGRGGRPRVGDGGRDRRRLRSGRR